MEQNNITETGPVGLKGLKHLEADSRRFSPSEMALIKEMYEANVEERNKNYPLAGTNPITPREASYMLPDAYALPESYGESKYDESNSIEFNPEDYSDFIDRRAEEMPAVLKYINGLGQATTLAGTTFLRSTAGLLYGAGTAIAEGRISGLWDNDVNNALLAIEEKANEAMPIYQSQYEQDHPWKTFFSPGSFSNNIIKNAGFMVGAAASGQLYGAALGGLSSAAGRALTATKAAKAGSAIARETFKQTAGNVSQLLIGGTLSAIGEGSVEAQHTYNEYKKAQMPIVREQFNQDMKNGVAEELMKIASEQLIEEYTFTGPEGQQVFDKEGYNKALPVRYEELVNQEWQNRLDVLDKSALRVGNATLAVNIPILTISNINMFGRLFRGGYSANKLFTNPNKFIQGNIKEGFERTMTKGQARALGMSKALGTAALEGTEEMSQQVASKSAIIWGNKELDDYLNDTNNPEFELELSEYMQALGQGMVNTFGNSDNWIEFAVGAFSSLLPIPVLKRRANGKLGIGLHHEVSEKIRETSEEYREAGILIDEINKRVKDPNFESQWKAAIANSTLQQKMNESTDDMFNFKNYEHRQLVHDVNAFIRAGQYEQLEAQVKEWSEQPMSDDFITSLRTSTIKEDGTSAFQGMTDEQLSKEYQERAKKLLKEIQEIKDINDNIKVRHGDSFSPEALDEMVYIRSQINNWRNRRNEMVGNYKLHSYMTTQERSPIVNNFFTSLRNEEIESPVEAKHKDAIFEYIDNMVFSEGIDTEAMREDLKDIFRIESSINNAIKIYNDYVANPNKLNKKAVDAEEKAKKQASKEETIDKATKAANNISPTSTFSDISRELSDIEDVELASLNNPKIKEAIEAKKKVENLRSSAGKNIEDNADIVEQIIQETTERNPMNPDLLNPDKIEEVFGEAFEDIANRIDSQDMQDNRASIMMSIGKAVESAIDNIDRLEQIPSSIESAEISETEASIEPNTQNEEEQSIFNEEKPELNSTILPTPQDNTEVINGSSKIAIRNVAPEAHIEGIRFKNGGNTIVHPDDVESWKALDEKAGVPESDYSQLYTWLKEDNMFEFLRHNTIPVGKPIYYMIRKDRKLNINGKETYPVFMCIEVENKMQVVGVTPNISTSENQTLKKIGKNIKTKLSQDSNIIISDYHTKVSRIVDGSLHADGKTRIVGRDFIISDSMSDRVDLGVVKNGTVHIFGGPLSADALSGNTNIYNYEGRPVLLIKGTSGKYKVLPLITETFKVEDVNNTENTAAQRIYRTIDKLASATNYEEVLASLNELRNWLYIPKLYFSSRKVGAGYLTATKNTSGKIILDKNKKSIILYDPLNPETVLTKEEKIKSILGLIDQLASEKPIVYQIPIDALPSNRAFNAAQAFMSELGLLKTNFVGTEIYNTNVISGNELFNDSNIEVTIDKIEETNNNIPSSIKREEGVIVDNNNQVVTSEETLQQVTTNIVSNTSKKPTIRMPQLPKGNAKVAKRRRNTNINSTTIDIKGTNNLESSNLSSNFAELNAEYKGILNSKGITPEDWNNASVEERNQLVNC